MSYTDGMKGSNSDDMKGSGDLLSYGLNERVSIKPAKNYGMDNKGKDMKPMPTPKVAVSEKGKKFTIC